MAFPQDFNTIQFAPEALLAHKDDAILFVYENVLVVIEGQTLVCTQTYDSYAYARSDAERAAISLDIKEQTPTDVRRSLENSDRDGVRRTNVDLKDLF